MPVVAACHKCGAIFSAPPSARRVFCSRACAYANGWREKKTPAWSRLRTIWRGMKWRCEKPGCVAFSYYGGRGIRMCQEWSEDFTVFYHWAISSGYTADLEIDRIDVDGNYEPSNCRWATRRQQMQNTRTRSNAKTSQYRGVSWCSNAQRWRVQVCSPTRVSPHVGLFESEDLAARAYDEVAKREFGEFARLNFHGGVPR